MTEAKQILDHLKALFQEIVRAVTTEVAAPDRAYGFNPKGDRVKWFDLAAHNAVSDYLENRFPCPVRLLSEEGTPREYGTGDPEFTLVVDPVDGSTNFERKLAPSGVAAALVPDDSPVSVETVEFALVGDLFTGKTWTAARGQGTFSADRRVWTSPVTQLEEALLGYDLDHSVISPSIARMLSRARGVRLFGSAARSLAMVAEGALDAHIDLRDDLTPENFLASSLVITEAGGLITDPSGERLPDIQSLTVRYSVLAAATPELHATLVRQIARARELDA